MARDGLEYEDVARVADALRERGIKPTNRLVLSETRGSASTVHRHLKRWLEENPGSPAPAPELPQSFQRAVQELLKRIQSEASADLEARLASAQQEAEDFARESEELQAKHEQLAAQLRAKCEELLQQLAASTAERDRLQGHSEQQAAQLERVQGELEAERRAHADARDELVEARFKVESAQEIAHTLRAEREQLRVSIEQERSGRVEVERRLAAVEASRQALEQREQERSAERLALLQQREELVATLESERERRGAIERALATREAEAKAALNLAEDLKRREEAIRSELRERAEVSQRAILQLREVLVRKKGRPA